MPIFKAISKLKYSGTDPLPGSGIWDYPPDYLDFAGL